MPHLYVLCSNAIIRLEMSVTVFMCVLPRLLKPHDAVHIRNDYAIMCLEIWLEVKRQPDAIEYKHKHV